MCCFHVAQWDAHNKGSSVKVMQQCKASTAGSDLRVWSQSPYSMTSSCCNMGTSANISNLRICCHSPLSTGFNKASSCSITELKRRQQYGSLLSFTLLIGSLTRTQAHAESWNLNAKVDKMQPFADMHAFQVARWDHYNKTISNQVMHFADFSVGLLQ